MNVQNIHFLRHPPPPPLKSVHINIFQMDILYENGFKKMAKM